MSSVAQRWGGALGVLVVLVALGSAGCPAHADEIEDSGIAYRNVVREELERDNPEAARLVEQADSDADAGRDDAALDGYEAARKLAPNSPHPLRRLCSTYAKLGRKPEAIARCKDALAKRNDAVQQAALAHALVVQPITSDQSLEAYELASKAATQDDVFADVVLCEASITAQKLPGLEKCSGALQRLAPHSAITYVFTAIYAASTGRYSDAKAAIRKARALGAPNVDDLEAKIDAQVPFYVRYGPYVWRFLAGWGGLLAFVVVAGFSLSALTRGAAKRLPAEPTGHAHGAARVLRVAYRFVLWLACLLFYLSLPVMIGSVVLLAVGLVYASLMVGRVPVQLLLIVCLVALVTVSATIRSLFARTKTEDPGTRLDLAKHPKLDLVLKEVAGKVGTRTVDTVFITTGTEFGVFERAGIVSRLRGAKAERCMMIGAGVLNGMRLSHFKAVLAHEYGHFQNEDTAGGGFALAVRRSTFLLIVGLAKGGAARWYNPAWWMARGFYGLFIRISHGASRLQEILADRWAAFSYGAAAFEGGLTHVVRREVEFSALADAKLKTALKENRTILNLYRGGSATEKPTGIEDKVDALLTRSAVPFDSHPPPQERFALVRRLNAPTPAGDDPDAKAWDLFEDRKSLERDLTRELLCRVEEKLGVRGLVARPAPSRGEQRPSRADEGVGLADEGEP